MELRRERNTSLMKGLGEKQKQRYGGRNNFKHNQRLVGNFAWPHKCRGASYLKCGQIPSTYLGQTVLSPSKVQ